MQEQVTRLSIIEKEAKKEKIQKRGRKLKAGANQSIRERSMKKARNCGGQRRKKKKRKNRHTSEKCWQKCYDQECGFLTKVGSGK